MWKKGQKGVQPQRYNFNGTDGSHLRKTGQRPAHRMSEVTSDLLEALNRTVRQKKRCTSDSTTARRGVKMSVSLVRSNNAKQLSQN